MGKLEWVVRSTVSEFIWAARSLGRTRAHKGQEVNLLLAGCMSWAARAAVILTVPQVGPFEDGSGNHLSFFEKRVENLGAFLFISLTCLPDPETRSYQME